MTSPAAGWSLGNMHSYKTNLTCGSQMKTCSLYSLAHCRCFSSVISANLTTAVHHIFTLTSFSGEMLNSEIYSCIHTSEKRSTLTSSACRAHKFCSQGFHIQNLNHQSTCTPLYSWRTSGIYFLQAVGNFWISVLESLKNNEQKCRMTGFIAAKGMWQ